ncbi:MAG: PhnD/SsuA/transferrin family substrate-binding protein, partial [Gammaproteobacteria bacterium]|nr:PhnD/SsuA/transferrin family substrate-binding protein [Gammaproteobacteria bacterium]
MKYAARLFALVIIGLAIAGITGKAMANPSNSPAVIQVGILAYQDKAKTAQQWNPLFSYLNQQLPSYQFKPLYLHNEEFTQAALSGELTFLFTQPAHYVSLSYQMSLTSPLVMLVNKEAGMALDHFGGLMVVRADNAQVKHMGDMIGKTIATVDKSTLGSFQMQAFELLEAGVDPFNDLRLLELGQPQENAIEAMLAGRADVAFVRTGVLESMVKSGRLKHQDVRIIDAQWRADFPFLTSTRLYPEWPLLANAQTDTQLIRDVTATLLSLAHNQELTAQLGISGFTIPGDYRMIDTLMRALKLPPFDQPTPLTLTDLWHHWHNHLVFLLVITLVALVVMLKKIRRLTQQMRHLQQADQTSRQNLAIEHLHLRTLLDTLPNLVWVKDKNGVYLLCNHRFEKLYGVKANEIIGKTDYDFVDKETADFFRKHDLHAFEAGKAITNEELLTFADGHQELCETVKIPMFDEQNQFIGILGVAHDITQRKADQSALQLKEAMLNRAQSVAKIGSWHIAINDKTLHWSDQTYRLFHIPIGTSVTYEDFINRVHPDDQDRVNSTWNEALKGATYNIKHRILVNNQTLWVHEIAELTIDEQGNLVSAVGTVQDITSKKADEARINQLAFYDPLTQLPNRSLLMEQLAQSIAIARREQVTQALILINIDRFKFINDAQGNSAGDALLIAFAETIKPLVGQGDLLSRISADEFALMAINIDKSP